MRLTRFLIASLFAFLFVFGTPTHAQAQFQLPANCKPATNDPNYPSCINGGASYFYSHQAAPIDCRILTCSLSYTPGGFPKGLPNEVKDMAAAANPKCKNKDAVVLPVNVQTHTKTVVSALQGDFVLQGFGFSCDSNGSVVLGAPPKGADIAFYSPGVMGTMSNVMGSVATIPVSSGDYVAYLKDTMEHPFSSPAYAQGLGFSSLRPVLALWRLFRNVAYFFFVLIFIAVGFMIMFRSKIGNQAAVTVQQALPKIVIALLLVTFSYAIAGLMIDLMYLVIYFMITIFTVSGAAGKLDVDTLTNIALRNNIFTNIWNLMTNANTGVATTIANQVGTAVTEMLNQAEWGTIAGVAGFGAGIIFMLVILVALLVNMFRIFFALIRAYVGVIFAVVFAPIQLLMGAIPGQNTFGTWIRGLMENLMAFPVIIFFLFCAQYFTYNSDFGKTGAGGFAAPQLGLQAGASGSFVLAILQFGILSMIPKAVEVAQGLVRGKLDIDPGKAMGEFYKQGKIGQTIGLTGLGLGAGALGGAAVGGALGLARGEGTLRERFTKGVKQGTILGAGGGAVVTSGLGWKIGKQVVREGAGAAVSIAAGDTINSALDRFDPQAKVGRVPTTKSKKDSKTGGVDVNS